MLRGQSRSSSPLLSKSCARCDEVHPAPPRWSQLADPLTRLPLRAQTRETLVADPGSRAIVATMTGAS